MGNTVSHTHVRRKEGGGVDEGGGGVSEGGGGVSEGCGTKDAKIANQIVAELFRFRVRSLPLWLLSAFAPSRSVRVGANKGGGVGPHASRLAVLWG